MNARDSRLWLVRRIVARHIVCALSHTHTFLWGCFAKQTQGKLCAHAAGSAAAHQLLCAGQVLVRRVVVAPKEEEGTALARLRGDQDDLQM